jgi:2'-5' RNA ligase
VVPPPELAALHARVEEEIAGLCAPLDPREDRIAFHPHLTIVQQVDQTALPTILARLDEFGPIPAFELGEAALVGRRIGADWQTLALAPFGA